MKVSNIVVLSTGALGLVLAGLHAWAPPPEPPPVASTSATPPPMPRAPEPPPPSVASRSPQASLPRPMPALPSATSPQAQGAHSPEATPPTADIDAALAMARQETDAQRRIEALQFLGEYALPQHLEPLQQIQMQDPSPEVRRSAEDAVHNLLARFAGQPWPGIPAGSNPYEYMRGAPSPTAP